MALKLKLDGKTHEVTIVRRRPHLVLSIDGVEHEIRQVPQLGDGLRAFEIDCQPVPFWRAGSNDRVTLRLGGRTFEVTRDDPFSQAGSGGGDLDAIKAPMPGAVVSVQKQAGDAVTRGETVITIESMKLQTALPSPRDGVIAEILKGEGMSFERDEVLVTLVPEAETGES